MSFKKKFIKWIACAAGVSVTIAVLLITISVVCSFQEGVAAGFGLGIISAIGLTMIIASDVLDDS